jgi:hypothetical protein
VKLLPASRVGAARVLIDDVGRHESLGSSRAIHGVHVVRLSGVNAWNNL